MGYGDQMLIGDVWISPPMVKELGQQLGVHVTTVRRWLRIKKIPEATYILLDLLHNGSIERIHPAWSGWRIDARGGDLESPVGTRIRAGEIMAIRMRYQQIAALECDVRELKKQLASRDREKSQSVKNDGGDAGDRQEAAGRAW